MVRAAVPPTKRARVFRCMRVWRASIGEGSRSASSRRRRSVSSRSPSSSASRQARRGPVPPGDPRGIGGDDRSRRHCPTRDVILWTISTADARGLVAGILLHTLVPRTYGAAASLPRSPTRTAAVASARGTPWEVLRRRAPTATGSPFGREGPTVQILRGVASLLGRAAGISPRSLRRPPRGAAAGVAAAFNAPIAAVTFAIEEVVGNLDQTLLSGVIVAAAFAAVIERTLLGGNPISRRPPELRHASSLVFYALLGVLAAGVSVLFTDSLLEVRRRFRTYERLPVWMHPAVGGPRRACSRRSRSGSFDQEASPAAATRSSATR